MTGHALFYVSHTIQLSRSEVLEALRAAALARARDGLRLVDPAPRGVEMETRILSGAVVEIDGAAVVIEAQLPADLAALLQTTPASVAPAACGVSAMPATADPAMDEPLVAA